MSDQGVRYLSSTGSDTNNGFSDQTAKRTLANALASFPNPYGDIVFLPGYTGTFSAQAVLRQGFRLLGTGSARGAATGGAELHWTGSLTNTAPVIITSPDDNTDWTGGLIRGVLIDGGGKAGDCLGIRNPQNMARVEDVRVQGYKGIGVHVYGIGNNAGDYPGFVTLDQVWAWGGAYGFQQDGGYTETTYRDCGVDSDANTLAGYHFVDGSARGLDADIEMLGCKFEAHPSGVSAVLHEGHAGVNLNSCSAKFGSPNDAGIAFHATQIPMRLSDCQSQGYGAFYTGPDGSVAADAHGGNVHRDSWPQAGGTSQPAPHSHTFAGTTGTT